MAAPSVENKRFNCPHCGAFADQEWRRIYGQKTWSEGANTPPGKMLNPGETIGFAQGVKITYARRDSDVILHNVFASKCESCENVTIWIGDRQIYPSVNPAPDINRDTPAAIAIDYHEAASIMNISPRGAAALLRLSIQKLCAHLGEPGKNINEDIASLVSKGLDPRIQRALDVLRVIGNEAVHPGTMDFKDDPDTVVNLFKLFNLIVDKMISEPKLVDDVYSNLPAGKIAAIDQRDR